VSATANSPAVTPTNFGLTTRTGFLTTVEEIDCVDGWRVVVLALNADVASLARAVHGSQLSNGWTRGSRSCFNATGAGKATPTSRRGIAIPRTVTDLGSRQEH
jgi:hypothetical protein